MVLAANEILSKTLSFDPLSPRGGRGADDFCLRREVTLLSLPLTCVTLLDCFPVTFSLLLSHLKQLRHRDNCGQVV